jgi:hypothetical protein
MRTIEVKQYYEVPDDTDMDEAVAQLNIYLNLCSAIRMSSIEYELVGGAITDITEEIK